MRTNRSTLPLFFCLFFCFLQNVEAQYKIRPTIRDSLNLIKYAPLISFTDSLLKNTEFHSIEISRSGIFGNKIYFMVSGKADESSNGSYYAVHQFSYKSILKSKDLSAISASLIRKKSKISPQNILLLFQYIKKNDVKRFNLARRRNVVGDLIGKKIILNYKKNFLDVHGYIYHFYHDEEDLKKEQKWGYWITENVRKYNPQRSIWEK